MFPGWLEEFRKKNLLWIQHNFKNLIRGPQKNPSMGVYIYIYQYTIDYSNLIPYYPWLWFVIVFFLWICVVHTWPPVLFATQQSSVMERKKSAKRLALTEGDDPWVFPLFQKPICQSLWSFLAFNGGMFICWILGVSWQTTISLYIDLWI